MNLIINTMQREKQRIDYMLEKYRTMLSMLPKGIVSQRNIGDKTYYYLKYRNGKSVVSKYIRKQNIEEILRQTEKRRHIEAMIKFLEEERRLASRVLEGNV